MKSENRNNSKNAKENIKSSSSSKSQENYATINDSNPQKTYNKDLEKEETLIEVNPL